MAIYVIRLFMNATVSHIRLIGFALAATTIMFIPFISSAQTPIDCSFGRTLELNVDGEDVRCLQTYLNGAGFTIAESGPGSVGNETSLFRGLTEAAVVRWQKANGVVPASGVFGPQSQAAYLLDLVN